MFISFLTYIDLGHANILKFAKQYRDWGATSVDEHDHILIERIRSVCRNKRDILYILGDVCMDITKMELLNDVPARKILVRGNHDNFDMGVYLKYFDKIEGFCRYKNHWLSHCPVHPMELRGRKNIHGHLHGNLIMCDQPLDKYRDTRYINVCVENCNGYPINFADIKDGTFKGEIKG